MLDSILVKIQHAFEKSKGHGLLSWVFYIVLFSVMVVLIILKFISGIVVFKKAKLKQ